MEFPKNDFGVKIGVYKVTSKVDNSFYIGGSRNIYKRWLKHRAFLRKNIHTNCNFQNIWNINSENNFNWEIIEECDFNSLNNREQFYMDTLNPDINIRKEVCVTYVTEDMKQKISETLKRKYKSKEIISKSFKKIEVYNLNNELLYTFESVVDCCKNLNLKVTKVSQCAIGLTFQHKGFIFKYKGQERIIQKIKIAKTSKYAERKVIDINSNIQYDNLIKCCEINNLNYDTVRKCLYIKDFYIKDNFKIARIKSDKLLENQEIDNQQPITTLNE